MCATQKIVQRHRGPAGANVNVAKISCSHARVRTRLGSFHSNTISLSLPPSFFFFYLALLSPPNERRSRRKRAKTPWASYREKATYVRILVCATRVLRESLVKKRVHAYPRRVKWKSKRSAHYRLNISGHRSTVSAQKINQLILWKFQTTDVVFF
jgi:hypothetical protein